MTAPTISVPTDAVPTHGRATELVLAHMHLKLASLALARVELETLAGLGGLDTQGLIDLAEVRWRTGDLVGAGEAATAALRADEADPIALIVAAEAASALGRPSEARRLATRAATAAPQAIDEIFAGMPRSGVWAPDANEPLPTAPTLFDRGPEPPPAPARQVEPVATSPTVTPTTSAPTAATAVALSTTPGFWDGDGTVDQSDPADLDPAHEFDLGRQALVAGAFDEAALRFGLALRLAPALALAVLEATEGARAASLSVVRGDAYRSAGHEAEARHAYAVAARGGLPERRSTVRVRPKSQPIVLPAGSDEEDAAAEAEPVSHDADVADAPEDGAGRGESGDPDGDAVDDAARDPADETNGAADDAVD